MFFNKGSISET